MIAGFEIPDTGRVLLHGEDVTETPPNKRRVNMVFQQYALFPHMSIYDNVAFGLKMKDVPTSEHREPDRRRCSRSSSSRGSNAVGRGSSRAASSSGWPSRAPSSTPGGAPPRRAARRARREAAPTDAVGAEAHPARARDDVRLRDARSGGGARDVRPDRRHERRSRRADRQPARDLRSPADAVRGRLHRLAERPRPGRGRARREPRRRSLRRRRADRRRGRRRRPRRRVDARRGSSRARSHRPRRPPRRPRTDRASAAGSPRSSTSACSPSSRSRRRPARSCATAWRTRASSAYTVGTPVVLTWPIDQTAVLARRRRHEL